MRLMDEVKQFESVMSPVKGKKIVKPLLTEKHTSKKFNFAQ